jgi:intracellular septation protein
MSGFGYTLRAFVGDILAMILFLAVVAATGNVALAVGLGIVLGLGQLAWDLARKTPVGALQWASLGLVIVSGGATLLTRDPRFVMLKPTAVYLVLAAVMLRPGWMDRYVPAGARAVAGPMLKRFGYAWAGLMILTAVLNLIVALTADPASWAKFNLYFQPGSVIALFLAQNVWMRRRRAAGSYALAGGDGRAG